MRRRSGRKVPSLGFWVASAALGLGACTDKNPTDEAAARDAGAAPGPEAPDRPSAEPTGDGGRAPALATVLRHDRGIVFGHFLVPDGAAVLRQAQQQLAIPAYKGFLDEAALRSLASLQLPEVNKPLAQNIDLSAPFGCVLVDFKAYDKAPLACTFGYKGGASQLLADLGQVGKRSDAGKHAAQYEIDGQGVFIDALEGQVVVSAYDDLFDKTRTYVRDNLIARADSVRGDLEVVGYVGDAFEFYRSDIDPLLEEYAKTQVGQTLPGSGHSALDRALAVWTDYNAQSTEQNIRSLGEMAQVTLHVGIEPIGVVGGLTVVPSPGSRLEASSRRSGGTRLETNLPAKAPRGTFMLAAAVTRPESVDDPNRADLRRAAIRSWAALTGRDAADAEQAVTEFLTDYLELYTGHSLFAVADVEGSPLAGVMVAAQLRPGKSARESFQKFATSFTPQAVLGPELSQWVRWTFETAVVEVDGAPLDRFTLEPTGEAQALLDRELSEDDRAQLQRWLGGMRLIAHRAELDDRVIWTLAPKAEESFARAVVAAQRGGDAAVDEAGTQRVLGYAPVASAILGVDVRATLTWLRGFDEVARQMPELPPLGNDLSDVFVVVENRSDGVFVGELVVTQALIEQAKAGVAQRAG